METKKTWVLKKRLLGALYYLWCPLTRDAYEHLPQPTEQPLRLKP